MNISSLGQPPLVAVQNSSPVVCSRTRRLQPKFVHSERMGFRALSHRLAVSTICERPSSIRRAFAPLTWGSQVHQSALSGMPSAYLRHLTGTLNFGPTPKLCGWGMHCIESDLVFEKTACVAAECGFETGGVSAAFSRCPQHRLCTPPHTPSISTKKQIPCDKVGYDQNLSI